MNQGMIAKMRWKKIRIRPIAVRITSTGEALPPRDDLWQIENPSRDKFSRSSMAPPSRSVND
jgi:hypothetical protein